jgi:RNA-binding protein PNO1
MPAPTALQRRPEEFAENVAEDMAVDASAVPLPVDGDDAELIDMNFEPDAAAVVVTAPEASADDTPMTDESGRPKFAPAKSIPLAFRREQRKVPIPPHRMTPLKTAWPKMYPPLVEHLKLQTRVNIKTRSVELRTSSNTTDTGALQKGEDFVKAFTLGFDVDDAIALLRLDDLYIETFEIKDVKTLQGEHMGRAIGRIAGKSGAGRFQDSHPRWLQEHPRCARGHRELDLGTEPEQGIWQSPHRGRTYEGEVLSATTKATVCISMAFRFWWDTIWRDCSIHGPWLSCPLKEFDTLTTRVVSHTLHSSHLKPHSNSFLCSSGMPRSCTGLISRVSAYMPPGGRACSFDHYFRPR